MQTEVTISELHARLTEAQIRGNNFFRQNFDLKQDVIERDNIIELLKSKEKRMEKQLELAEKNQRVALAELSEVKFTLRGMEQQVDRLNSEILSLTNAMQQYKTKMEQKESHRSDLIRENEILKIQLEAKAERYRETLEQEIGIVQLKQSLDNYLLHKDEFLQNLRYCKDCYATQRELEELVHIRRDYKQMKDENGELNQQLIVCGEENQLLKYKIMSVEADYAKKIGMHQNDYELMKEALKNLYHEMCTDSNPVTQKRPSDERSESHVKKPRIDDSNIPEPDLGDDRQSRKDSCRPVHATSYSDRTPDTMAKSPYRTASSPENTSQSGSPVCRTITTVAQIHAEPGKSDNSHKEKPRKKKAKQNVTRESARNKGKHPKLPDTNFSDRASQSRDRIPDPADRLPSGKVSTPFVSSNRGKANTDTDKENEDGRSKNCDNGLSGDESTSDDYALLRPLHQYSKVWKNSNASQYQTRKRDQTK